MGITMKIIIKSALCAAILITAPTQAMFSHMGKAFRTAVMNRGFSTQPSLLASIHNGRRPLTTLGALIGLGSTGYAVQQATKRQPLPAHINKSYCSSAIAQATYEAIRAGNDDATRDKWIKERAQAFNYCQKIMSKEEIYHQNIFSALRYNLNYTILSLLSNKRPPEVTLTQTFSSDPGHPIVTKIIGYDFSDTLQKLHQDYDQYKKDKADSNKLFSHFSV